MLVFDPSAKFVVGFPYGLDWEISPEMGQYGARQPDAGIPSLWYTNPEKRCELSA